MVKPGYRAPTIKESTAKKLDEIAEKLNKSVPETILYLCEQFTKNETLEKERRV